MKNDASQKKVIVVLGPTASGKSSLAVKLAKKFNGEIVSADSRQVYRGLDIGTGKITKKEMGDIRHHLLDIANPKDRFTVAEFKKGADDAIEKIGERKKIPILCGGTGFYIQAVVNNVILPEVHPNNVLRNRLTKKSTGELARILNKLDSEILKSIDVKNPRRLIRAIEIATVLGKVPKFTSIPIYKTLQIGLKTPDRELRKKISLRLFKRIKEGMIAEVVKLHEKGLSWKRMEELGLEYRYVARYLQKKISRGEMVRKLEIEIWHYARRQKTWFKKDKRIKWFSLNEKKKIEKEIQRF